MSTEPSSFTVDLDNGLSLTVPDIKTPLWHGSYGPTKDGMLTIYKAESSGVIATEETAAFIGIYTEEHSVEDFLTFTWYSVETPVEVIIKDIHTNILTQYCTAKATAAIETASNTSRTIH